MDNSNSTDKTKKEKSKCCQFITTNWIRLLVGIVCVVIFFCFLNNRDYFYNEENTSLEMLSYWSSVFTVIALIIAIAEIAHSTYVNKSIYIQAKAIFKNATMTQNASILATCSHILDQINEHIDSDDRKEALKSYQYARKVYLFIYSYDNNEYIINKFNILEQDLQWGDGNEIKPAPLKRQVLQLKHALETINK
ncbi:hypothetical protein AB7W46_11780 [Providencia rettgeri]